MEIQCMKPGTEYRQTEEVSLGVSVSSHVGI